MSHDTMMKAGAKPNSIKKTFCSKCAGWRLLSEQS